MVNCFEDMHGDIKNVMVRFPFVGVCLFQCKYT